MTNETGSKNPSPPASEDKAPWERVWNDMAHGLSIIGDSLSDTFIPKAPPSEVAPWERPWGSSVDTVAVKRGKK